MLNLFYKHQLRNAHFYVKLVFHFVLQFTDKYKRTSTSYAFKNNLIFNLSSFLCHVLTFEEEELRLDRYT